MTPFLKQVADWFFDRGDIGKNCFVFPNRRSMAFFSRYLCQAVADAERNAAVNGGDVRPVYLPQLLTVNDFFYKACDSVPTDRVALILELYDCYKSLNPNAESLDDFIFWGDVILSDFDDVDKYRIDAERLFTNVADFRAIQDTYSYLSDDQRAAVEQFVSHFREASRLRVDLDAEDPSVKVRFLRIWNILGPLYRTFRERLASRGMSYEGMAYRALADRLSEESAPDVFGPAFPEIERFIFVGLNALNGCEKLVMKRLRDAQMAGFCWDYGPGMVSHPDNRSSLFMRQNVIDYPQEFQLEPEPPTPRIEVISVPSSVGQAKQIPSILKEIAVATTEGKMDEVGLLTGNGSDCAVVLPDETLLAPVLNSIPEEIKAINVTMGFPLTGSAFCALMNEISTMQMHVRMRDGKAWLYHRQVWNILSGSLLRKVMGKGDAALAARPRREARYYIPESDFESSPLLRVLMHAVVTNPSEADAGVIRDFAQYQLEVISAVAPLLRESPDLAPELEFARRYYQCVNRLRNISLDVKPQTYVRLLGQLLSGESVPYSGEPLKGLQIMGPLETRALDFSNIVVLSCNEGVFPKRSVSSSFIPPELRKGFGLPTYEYQDAVWAYYFYRMIRRASRVWLLYDSRTESLRSGEESRYIKQLQYHFRVPLNRSVATAPLRLPEEETEVQKPADMALRLQSVVLSATAVQRYLACPVQFFYANVEGLSPEAEVAESLDAGMIGSVYHAAMQALYLGPAAMDPSFPMDRKSVREAISSGVIVPLKKVTMAYLEDWLKRSKDIRARIRTLIQAELRTIEVSGRNLVFEGVILQYVLQTLRQDRKFLLERQTDSFEVLGLELPREWNFSGRKFFGYIDRLDRFDDGVVRVVDYKSGKVTDNDVLITDDNAENVAEMLFGPDNSKRPKIALQLFLYDMFVAGDAGSSAVDNVIYPAGRLFSDGPLSSRMNGKFCGIVKERLGALLDEMADPSVPLRRTEDRGVCQYCDFRIICGR